MIPRPACLLFPRLCLALANAFAKCAPQKTAKKEQLPYHRPRKYHSGYIPLAFAHLPQNFPFGMAETVLSRICFGARWPRRRQSGTPLHSQLTQRQDKSGPCFLISPPLISAPLAPTGMEFVHGLSKYPATFVLNPAVPCDIMKPSLFGGRILIR